MNFQDLLQQSESRRNSQWEKDFLHKFPSEKINVESEETKMGPDYYPYLFVRSEGGQGEIEPVNRVVEWLSTRGTGLVLNAHKEIPDYVFTYGMIWHFREAGLFQLEGDSSSEGRVAFEEGQKILSGPPSEDYVPFYVREVLKQFFRDQGLKNSPRWLVVSSEGTEEYHLCFSLESLGAPPHSEHRGIVESLSWFFPNHFSLVLIQEEHFPQFYELDAF